MRMTNEEFQAEVFRRAGTYQQKRSRRVRFMTGAVGFACCLIVAVAALPRLTNGMRSDEVWENAREDIMADEAQGYCDSSEAAAEDSDRKYDTPVSPTNGVRENGDTLSIDNHDNDTNSCAEPEESSSEDSASDSSADPGVFVEKTEEELLEHYGLDALPEQIGGMAPVRDRSKGWYHTVEPLGLTVSEQDADQVISDYNTWFYMSWDPMRSAYLTLFTWQYDDTAPSYSYPDDDPDRNVEYVVFSVNGIGVSLETGFCSHEETEQIVAEITDYLKAHKTNG